MCWRSHLSRETTNNQIADVDEADFIKNDNKYIYIVSGKVLRIIKAWPATETKELAKVTIEGTPRKLFVYQDRVLIYSSLDNTSHSSPGNSSPFPSFNHRNQECTYGYACDFTGDGHPTLPPF